MSDAGLIWNDAGADVLVQNGDLFPDNGLATAVLISLFTDARAPSAIALPQGETTMRGWWGDLAQRTTGSLLWLIFREKMVPEVAERAREYTETALGWMIEEGFCEKVEVTATLMPPQSLQLIIKIYRGQAKAYSYLWDAVAQYSETAVQNTSIKLHFIE